MAAPQLLDSALDRVVGSYAARKLKSLGLETTADLLGYFPRRYAHWGRLTPLVSVSEGEDVTLLARVRQAKLVRNRSRGVRLVVELTDGQGSIDATFFAQHPGKLAVHQRLLVPGSEHLFAGKVSRYRSSLQLTHPQFEQFDDASGVKERASRPIPIYPATSAVPTWLIARATALVAQMLRAQDVDDPLTDGMRSKYDLLPLHEALVQVHTPTSDDELQRALRTVRWVEALDLQTALGQRRLVADSLQAPVVETEPGGWLDQARQALPFELTGGQQAALEQILSDMACAHPMQRLLQADVGAGKTVVAALALTAAVEAGFQGALLAPTEVLAEQHVRSLSALLPVPVELLTGSSSAAVRTRVHQLAANAQPTIFVGTHALLEDSLKLAHLALVVVDEQHRFGVAQRDALLAGGSKTPHLLAMTATPIPRTVAMTVFGDLDVTVVGELPAGRKPVQTFLVDDARRTWVDRVWVRAREEIDAGGRVFVVTSRIDSTAGEEKELASVEDTLTQLRECPALQGAEIAALHGRMSSEQKATTIAAFNSGQVSLLVTTTVIEVGVDIRQASMMVILDAQQFGLSQLHQLRGRVGRGDKPAVCMAIHRHDVGEDSIRRLQAFASSSDGFELAEADLELRREGDVLGQSQSGKATSLKALRVLRDRRVIEQARKEVRALLADDPHLRSHPQLARRAERLGEQVQWLSRT
ncbi:MAG: ATP-dependent DNA helicase RecG [Actinomycetaceae bacterium]|nr:ATP-dependent DNA helicase RecG [Actinomycetaceae bacterium]